VSNDYWWKLAGDVDWGKTEIFWECGVTCHMGKMIVFPFFVMLVSGNEYWLL